MDFTMAIWLSIVNKDCYANGTKLCLEAKKPVSPLRRGYNSFLGKLNNENIQV